MPGPTQLITDHAKIDRQYDAMQKRREETLAAYEAGGLAYHAAIREIDAEPAKEAAARVCFESGNPYKMISYGDEGHQRPAWFRGFNDAMAALYGVRVPRYVIQKDERPDGLNGRDAKGDRIQTYTQALETAKRMTEEQRAPFWAEDRGPSVHPRYAVIPAFQIGEPVSYGFNGDSYPCGRIIAITSPSDGSRDAQGKERPECGYRIITVQDHNGNKSKFWRRRLSGSWKKNETWSLQHGWHQDRNPSF